MPKLAVSVVLPHESGFVQFLSGDELPGWAIGLVGDHCLVEPAADPVDLIAVEPVPEVVAEPEVPEAEPEKVEPAAEPDFTQPAPAKRGRPRKAE